MDEYIEREEIRRGYEKLIRSYVNGDSYIADWRFDEMIENLPATDVAPVVHGRWIEMEFLMPHPYYTCSVCGKDIYMEETGDPASDLFTYTYCPQCGAKMDERSINGEDEC